MDCTCGKTICSSINSRVSLIISDKPLITILLSNDTWLLMLFLGNVGLGISYWGTLPLGVIVSLILAGSSARGSYA